MNNKHSALFIRVTVMLVLAATTGCTAFGNFVNPYYEEPSEVALKGQANDHALNGSKDNDQRARVALEAAATHQRAHTPAPYHPVWKPAVVRLMWVPDHLNRYGDLVPSHYYYLKVLDDRPAVQDAFELEGQLNTGGAVSNVPYIRAGGN